MTSTSPRPVRGAPRPLLLVAVLLGAFVLAPAAGFPPGDGLEAQVPSSQERGALTAADYERAEAFLSGNLSSRVHRAQVSPQWHDDDRFSYRVQIPGGHEFIRVDAARGTRERAFDHERLSAALSRAADDDFEALRLPFSSYTEIDDGRGIEVFFRGTPWRCDLREYECERGESAGPQGPPGVQSPDGRWVAFRRANDLWVHDRESGEQVRLTTDGEDRYGYATNSQGWTRSEQPILLWSPDSRRIATFRLDERGVGEAHLLRTQDGRPGLVSWPYAIPGDTIVPMLERVVIDVEERRVVELDTPPDHQRTSSCCGMTRGPAWADVEWSPDGETLAFVSVSRDYRTATLRIADPVTGAVRTVLEESHPQFFESHAGGRGVPNWRVLHDRGEVLWFSQRDGWGHLFRYDLESGDLLGRVTGGDWNLLDIVRIDEGAGTLLFTGIGRELGDPYHTHFYRVNLDGTGLTHLTPEDADHQISLSPDGRWFTSRHSTVDTPPVTVLRRTRDGQVVRTLEEADVAELEELGWRAPIPFTAKARDGVTDVYGLMVLPSDFDPEKRYPIINAIYPGPQAGSVGTRSFSVSRRGQAHALAELGFVIVLIDAMGNPERSKRFHTAYYGDMGDNGLPDQISAMRELARRHAFIDLDRVGIFGHSGGGFASAAALLRHPYFFHVGVASAGNHDNAGYTFYWGEKWHGLLEEGPGGSHSYERQANHLQAANLEGKLLITYGTMDANVLPNTTLQLVDALIRENKDFDLMVFPNRGHGYSQEPYHMRITWDYFVRHLLGKEPPRGYRIGR